MIRVVVALSLISAASLAATYSVVPIPLPNGFAYYGMGGINNSGQVAITAIANDGAAVYVGTPSGSTPVPLPSGWTSGIAYSINASGQVTGAVTNPTASVAFIGGAAGSAVIPFPSTISSAGRTSTGNALNDAGQTVGTISSVQFASPAFLGSISGSVLFPSPGLGGQTGQPNAVNNSGIVAGAIVTSYFLSAGTVSNYQEFIGTPAAVTLVPPPPGYVSAEPWAINSFGQVTGVASSNLGTLFISEQAFVGTAAGSTLIPYPTGASFASVSGQSINDLGIVVGFSNSGGWIWDVTNGIRRLNSLVPSGWTVTNGISISNNGLILAQASFQGGASQYVELIPAAVPGTPAPSTLSLTLIGVLLCWGWWARGRRPSRNA